MNFHNLSSLPERLAAILCAIVEAYVESGGAVGSKAVVERAGLGVSSATVRAAMAELMELGLLAQPHRSAGRVPTERAFRLYVDRLLTRAGQLPAPKLALGTGSGDVDRLVRGAVELLGEATGQLGFLVSRSGEVGRLERLLFVRVSSERVMALLVARDGSVRSRLVEETECGVRELEQISARLSELVHGRTLAEARASLREQVEAARERRDALWRKLAALGSESLGDEPGLELYVGDRNRLFGQPDFDDVPRLRELFVALEEKERMLALLDGVLHSELQVVIGDELEDPALRTCAVIAAPMPGGGGLGVIGPVRMRYDRIIPVVQYVSERVGDAIA